MKILATILARGGSKGVKNKNIRNLLGKPLIAHTIEQLKSWGKFDTLIVSTDSTAIAEVALQYGADVPFMRNPELASDTASKIDGLRDALIRCEKLYNRTFDAILDLDTTAPVRKISDIDSLVNDFKKHTPDCIFSVVAAHKNPYFNMVETNPDGTVALCKKLPSGVVRRQDAPKVFDMNASMYIYKRDFLLNPATKMCYDGITRAYEMNELSAFDIDREIDFKFVEMILKEKLYP